jgi:plastocyanin
LRSWSARYDTVIKPAGPLVVAALLSSNISLCMARSMTSLTTHSVDFTTTPPAKLSVESSAESSVKLPVEKESHHQAHSMGMGMGMSMNSDGIVMNTNHQDLPWGCESISQDFEFAVRAGRGYAKDSPGMVFGMSQHEYNVAPCSRITVTFTNEDEVRHQWMVHGLPNYLYPTGMFHLEAMGGKSVSGTFIVPGDHKTYLIHCDMAQHMEKGMKGQLKVGKGSGDLWSIPTVSDTYRRSDYLPKFTFTLMSLLGLTVFFVALYVFRRRR